MNFLKMLTRATKAAAKASRQSPSATPKPVRVRPQVAVKDGPAGCPMIACREGSFPFAVVGEARYQDALSRIVGGHNREGHGHECVALLVPEPSNKYDPNAVQVVIGGEPVGYIPKEATVRIHAASASFGALACQARIDGGWKTNQHDAGHFGVKLAIPNRGKIAVV
jgi:hypothetical protein